MKQDDFFAGSGEGRDALLARWWRLTREVLPGMAADQGWPIRLDHFMRVCLDAALGAPWTAAVKAPAVRHMSDDQLAAALRVAEGVAARPDTLPELNARSIAGRRAARERRAFGGTVDQTRKPPSPPSSRAERSDPEPT